ncbi:hypothetical protein FQR65_LT15823 [Abscondita terminalis]|nr:hypothetical protein FQR65_LT15823 [Abscondita terminalis]
MLKPNDSVLPGATGIPTDCTFKIKDAHHLWDELTNHTYSIDISEADYLRAQTDELFAQTLMDHVKLMEKSNLVTQTSSAQPTTSTGVNCTRTTSSDLTKENELDNESESTTNIKWAYNETILLIIIVENYLEDLNHTKKKIKSLRLC